jgi:hypothetical protein
MSPTTRHREATPCEATDSRPPRQRLGLRQPSAAFKSRRPLQKRQVVVGLLTDSQEELVFIQVYRGNTSDLKTFGQQVHMIKKELGCEGVTLVGDRGMIRTAQKAAAQKADFQLITALTQPQIQELLAQKVCRGSGGHKPPALLPRSVCY